MPYDLRAAPKPAPAVELPKYRAWIRLQRCVVPGCPNPAQACHYQNRRMYGDIANLFPCCAEHHVAGGEAQHARGIETFQRLHRIELARECAKFWAWFTEGEAFLIEEGRP